MIIEIENIVITTEYDDVYRFFACGYLLTINNNLMKS